MTPTGLRAKVIAERSAWIREMLSQLRTLPLDTHEAFRSDPRNVAAAESYLRRGLEALLDLGRHILAKAFGEAVSEYKEIAEVLVKKGVLNKEEGEKLRRMAGYRNRMVHFYQEISDQELYEICSQELKDLECILSLFLRWVEHNPEKVDQHL
jgi:uncharacterized protein YutE (UPF0331/DUF86 family)